VTSETSSVSSKPASAAAATKRVSFLSDDGAEPASPSAQFVHERKRFASVTEDDIHSYLLHHTGVIDSESEHDYETESEYDSDVHSLCWSCARVIRNKSKAVPKSLIKFGKGKSCMTSLGVSDDDSSMPNPHSLVANYARMLVEDRPRFVETIFRAVKLNKLDVTKILCKIIQVFTIHCYHTPSVTITVGEEV